MMPEGLDMSETAAVNGWRACSRVGLLLAAVFCMASSASAQLSNCPKPSGGRPYAIYLDEIYQESPAAAGVARVSLDRLSYRLASQLESFIEDDRLRPEIIVCTGRKPRGESDFNRQQVDTLNVLNVVLEIWGRMETQPGATGTPETVMLIGYAVIPLRFYEHFVNGSATVRGVYITELNLPAGSPLNVLERNSDLRAYSLLGIGVKALKIKKYDAALSSFCKASLHLSEPPPSDWNADRKALIEHARAMAGETVQRALGDTAYNGGIRLLPPAPAGGSVCPSR